MNEVVASGDTAEVMVQWTSTKSSEGYIVWVNYNPNLQLVASIASSTPTLTDEDRVLFEEEMNSTDLNDTIHRSFEEQFLSSEIIEEEEEEEEEEDDEE